MLIRKFGFILAVPLLLVILAANSYAEISNAAVLFLRIAPGARAAGMGEAFVAVADDATTTHWNPAGLGAYPLADGWTVADVPRNMRPLKAIAAVKKGGGSDYRAYEIWGLSDKGLVRFDNHDWYSGEVFNTRTDQTVKSIVASYFKVQDEDLLAEMVERVAKANSNWSREQLQAFRDSVMDALPEDYNDRDIMALAFDSLQAAWDEVRIRPQDLVRARQLLKEGLAGDSALGMTEADRVRIAVERAKARFIPEELVVPYSVLFEGTPTAIASSNKMLVVGAANGLFAYNGRNWRTYTDKDGLPSREVLSLQPVGGMMYVVGTTMGPALFTGRDITSVKGAEVLPEGSVTAIGGDGLTRLWLVLDGELYRFDGTYWSRSRAYTIAVGDNPELIAEKNVIYGTPEEKQAFIKRMKDLNSEPTLAQLSGVDESPVQVDEDEELLDITDIGKILQEDSAAAVDTVVTGDGDTTFVEAADTTAAEQAAAEEAPAEPEFDIPEIDWDNLNPGDEIRIPYAVDIKGRITAMYGHVEELYMGTEYGLLYFDGSTWAIPGYKEIVADSTTTMASLVEQRRAKGEAERAQYREALIAINGLTDTTFAEGDTVLVYRNATGSQVNQVRKIGPRVYLATSDGLRVLTNNRIERVTEKGMDRANAIYMDAVEDELWLASDEKIIIKANGRTEFSLMHVNWLPELADDMYYEFLSGVFGLGDIGTAGLSFTYLTYGTITRTGNTSDPLGTFESFDMAVTGSFGSTLKGNLKWGASLKFIYSRLAEQGAGSEKGEGTSTGLAFDMGLLYQWTPRLNLGMAVTNIGPDVAYIDAAQADPLPRNLALGFAYKLIKSDYNQLLITGELNKILVDVDGGIADEFLKESIFNVGTEFTYADLISARAGYIYDQEGKVKTLTLGAGLKPLDWLKADFSYIPNNDDVALANTLRMSFSIMP